MNVFRKALESNEINEGACVAIADISYKLKWSYEKIAPYLDFFDLFFQPTYDEMREYNCSYSYYFQDSQNPTLERHIALLICAELWEDKLNRKYSN